MTGSLNISLIKNRILQPAALIAAGYIIIAVVGLHNYLPVSSSGFLLGMIALPFVLQTDTGRPTSYRYAWITFIAGLLCFLMPVKTLFFFTVCFALIFVKESFYGRTGMLMPAIVMLASPVFHYLANTFSFPVRMQLTQLAGYIFRLLGYTAEVQGNVIIYQGNEFSVDPACMGLNMITTSLLLGVILIAFYQTKFNRKTGNWWIILYLFVILLFNIIANLFRIILLVLFNIPPESVSHDVAGIGCLLIYVFLPAVLLASFVVRSPVKKKTNESTIPVTISYKPVLFHLLVLVSILLLVWKVFKTDTFNKFNIPSQQEMSGYSITSPVSGIVKLEKPNSLIYVKYIRGFYDTDHNPMICWTGSGYQFEKIQNESIGDKELFTATLVNGNDKLYSAWWYDNGISHTTNQFEWRWNLVKGSDPYVLVNVTCSSKEKLSNEVKAIFQHQTLLPFFKKYET
jgi:exosortase N